MAMNDAVKAQVREVVREELAALIERVSKLEVALLPAAPPPDLAPEPVPEKTKKPRKKQ